MISAVSKIKPHGAAGDWVVEGACGDKAAKISATMRRAWTVTDDAEPWMPRPGPAREVPTHGVETLMSVGGAGRRGSRAGTEREAVKMS